MLNQAFRRRVLAGFGALVASMFLGAAGAQAQQSSPQGYVNVDPPQATAAGGKIEVLEFFQYGCPHCRAMEPLTKTWLEKQKDDVALQRVPVAFNAAMEPWQRLYFTLESMDRLDLQQAVFNAVQVERNQLNNRERVLEWLGKQGLDQAKAGAMYDSFGIVSKVNRANQLIKAYNLQSVPTIVVDGRYMTSPALANGYQQSLDKTTELVSQVRSSR